MITAMQKLVSDYKAGRISEEEIKNWKNRAVKALKK